MGFFGWFLGDGFLLPTLKPGSGSGPVFGSTDPDSATFEYGSILIRISKNSFVFGFFVENIFGFSNKRSKGKMLIEHKEIEDSAHFES